MFNAYAEIGLFVLSYLVCSRCRVSIYLPVWPTYELLYVLHCHFYMPLHFILLSGILSRIWLYMLLLDRKVIFKLTFLNKLVPLCMSRLWHVRVRRNIETTYP
jgi:hypothetical protein